MIKETNNGVEKKDKLYIVALSFRNVEDYIKGRVEHKMNLYSDLAKCNKRIFWCMTATSMICAAIVPVLINQKAIEHSEIWATVLSLVVTILVGMQGIFHPREHWRNYDMIYATLRREEMLFSTKSGEYKISDDVERFHLLVNRVEDLIAREREETIIMRTSEKDTSGNSIIPNPNSKK